MMNTQRTTKISKFLSLVLRHEPEKIGIKLDDAGWVAVRELLDALARSGFPVGEQELHEVVRTNDKKRFAFNDNCQMIRANQGHSVSVELGHEATIPPEILYHGTVDRFLNSIRRVGLLKGDRHHVHMSPDAQTALKVGQRRGRPVLLNVHSGQMNRDGIAFFLSPNGVWLTDHVPPRYIEFPEEAK
jgi:putative RNA 2'-phosphotransferase